MVVLGCVRRALAGVFLVSGLVVSASSQCQLTWQPGLAAAGVHGAGFAVTALANGDLVVGGPFEVAGGVVANGVARFDGSGFQALGSGVVGSVFELVAMSNGDIVVGGSLTSAGGATVANIARWDGIGWSPLGSGTNGTVWSMVELPNGDLVAVGSFSFAGGVPCGGIARWDGSSWSPLGSGPAIETVRAVAIDAGGQLLAAGSASSGIPVQRWNGVSWSTPPGIAAGQLLNVGEMLVRSNGDVITIAYNSNSGVQRYDGSSVSNLAPPVPGGSCLGEAPNGDLLLGSNAWTGNAPLAYRFDGVAWTALTGNPSLVRDFAATSGGRLYAAASASPSGLLEVVGTVLQPVTVGVATELPEVAAVQALPNGDVVVGGSFTSLGGIAANNIARWDGSSYQPLGAGVDGEVTALGLAPDGTLVVGGTFQNAGGAPASLVARWDGSSWSPIGSGPGAVPRLLTVNAGGEILFVAGQPYQHALRWWNGADWVGVAVPDGVVQALTTMPSGEFVIGGSFFSAAPGGLYTFSNGALTSAGLTGTRRIAALAISPVGDLVFSEGWPQARISRLAGGLGGTPQTLWLGSGPQTASAIMFLPDGDMVAAGPGLGGIARRGVNQFELIDGGVAADGVTDLAFGARGELFAVGSFAAAGGHVSVAVARATSNCPAAVTSVGVGCAGSAGPVTLTSDERPWVDSVFDARATGMASPSLALQVLGFAPANQPLPLGVAGCVLNVDPVLLDVRLPQAGLVGLEVAIPAVALGQNLYLQAVGIELAPSQAVLQTTSSNALRLQVGQF